MFGYSFFELLAFFIYPASVLMGMEAIKAFSDTTPVTTYSSMCLVGGLILTVMPVLDVLVFVIQTWRGKVKFKD